MSVRQLHYTSCQDGLEGIEGFQVSAATPGVPKTMVDLAVRVSAYEAGPALVQRLADDDLSGFPVAFGYTTEGRAGALFQSRYVGRDFTGRLGNYFAHAVLVDDVDHEFADVLPIDLWGSPVWTATWPSGVTELPELDRMPLGPVTGPDATRQFMAVPGRQAELTHLISAVQPLLARPRERLILIVADDKDAARWLAALTRSLPRQLSLQVSFVTYTSRPEEQEVLISCVTPDVRVSTYGGFTVLDLTDPQPRDVPEDTMYARLLAAAWTAGRADDAITLAKTLRPELAASELEVFSTVLALCMGFPLDSTVDEQHLVSAIAFAEHRLPSGLPAHAWQQAADAAVRMGLRAVDSWSPVLRSAQQQGRSIPAELMGAYYLTALAADTPAWVPRLDAAQLEDIAERTALPALTESTIPVGQLAAQHDLMDAIVRALDRHLATEGNPERLATKLTPQAAELLTRHGRTVPRVRRVAEIALARHGEHDRIDVLVRLAHQGDGWQDLGRVLWPELPSAQDAVQAVRKVPPRVLGGTGLTERFVERILQDAEDGQFTNDDVRLASALLNTACVQDIPPNGRVMLEAVCTGAALQNAVARRVKPQQVADALELVGSVAPTIAGHLLGGIINFLLRVDDPARHVKFLEIAVRTEPRRFLPAYSDAAVERLAGLSPQRVAQLAVAWAALGDKGIRQHLVEETLAKGMSQRRRGDLDKVGEALQRMSGGDELARAAGVRGGGWSKWWQDWRQRHERRRGLLNRLLSPRSNARKR